MGGPEDDGTLEMKTGLGSGAADHDLRGFDEGDRGVTGFQGQVAGAVGGDDGGDALVADGEDHLGEKAVDDDFNNSAEELVTAADSSRTGFWMSRQSGMGQKLHECIERNPVVASRGLDRADARGEDPVFESGVADANFVGGLAWREQGG